MTDTSIDSGEEQAAGEGRPRRPEQGLDKKTLQEPWAPLRIPEYRTFWIAGLVSNMGTWMHETGAQWQMTSLDPSPEMVSAVRTCMTIPVFCLALPAGVWADRFDRRRWLIGTQILLLMVAATMALLAAGNYMSPWLLLLLTSAMGIGMILNQPAWQSLTPELVPPALIPSAVSVGSISFNLARSLGPALAGLLIAQFGIWCTFFFNACSFLAVVLALIIWKPSIATRPAGRKKKPPQFWDELRKGLFVIKNSSELSNTLLRLCLFAIPASILWSLLALVATERLGFQERGFGFCLGIIGTGAVLGASVLPAIRLRFSSELIVLTAQLAFAAICTIIGMVGSPWVILPMLLLIGACWMSTMTTFNANAQVYLPQKFRARGMAAFIMAFALGMAIGSALWGWLAKLTGIGPAFVVAGIVLAGVALATHPLKLGTMHIEHEAK